MRLPFFYGWIIVAVTFVTMAIGVNARTAFSLFFPPIIDEFGWERGVTAGAFSFGFVVSGAVSPLIGRMMDRFGPRGVMELGVALMGGGLLLAPLTTQPWHLYLTIGVLVGAGSVCLGYSGQSLFLPNWFIRRRGLAMGLAFAGVGIGSVTLLPWVQHMIEQTGWRTACTAMGILVLVVLAPINLLLRRAARGYRPAAGWRCGAVGDIGQAGLECRRSRLGRHRLDLAPRASHRAILVDRARLFLRPVHLVRGAGAPDQIPARHRLQRQRRGLGARRRSACSAFPARSGSGISPTGSGANGSGPMSCAGFAICFAALIALKYAPVLPLVYLMIFTQGALGYGLTSIMGAVVLEIFQGKQYGSIFGTIMLAALAGGAAGPWATGLLYDLRAVTRQPLRSASPSASCRRLRSGRHRRARCARSRGRCTRRKPGAARASRDGSRPRLIERALQCRKSFAALPHRPWSRDTSPCSGRQATLSRCASFRR